MDTCYVILKHVPKKDFPDYSETVSIEGAIKDLEMADYYVSNEFYKMYVNDNLDDMPPNKPGAMLSLIETLRDKPGLFIYRGPRLKILEPYYTIEEVRII